MVKDEMLRQAAGEVELAVLNSLSAKKIEPHQFSERFERKMKKLISRVKHPIRYNILRSAAAIILIIFVLFSSLVAFVPEVRASVIGWFKETFYEFFQYSSPKNTELAEYEYHFAAAPEGYSELQVIDGKDGKTFLYVDDSGNILQFTYVYGGREDNFFVKADSYTLVTDKVNDVEADIYLTANKEETNVIIWWDSETDTLLCINANIEKELLITFAETVTKIKK